MKMLCNQNALWAAPVLAMLLIAGCGDADDNYLDAQTEGALADDEQTTAGTTPGQLIFGSEKELIQALKALDGPVDVGNKTEAGTERQKIFFVDPTTGRPTQKVQVVRDVKKFSDDTWILDGFYGELYPDGKKYQQGRYSNAQRVGEWTFWHPNGQVAKVVSYKDGKENGSSIVYRADGTQELVREYKAGKRHGKWLSYDDAGQQPNGQLEYKEGVPHGSWIDWYDSGQKREEKQFKDGKLDGTVTRWHDNGQVAQRTYFKAGRRHGLDTVYNATGQKIREIRYAEGKVVPNVDS